MPFRLGVNESVVQGVRRVARTELDAAVRALSSTNADSYDGSIHKARKSIKKIRGLLRLVQPTFGEAYEEEVTRLRDCGRRLSGFRDARAIIDTFDELAKKYKDDLDEHTITSTRAGLLKRKEESDRRHDVSAVRASVASKLGTISRRIKTWKLAGDGFPAIAEGLERTFRRGRRALSIAVENPDSANYHSWRKRVKEHGYHIRLLQGPGPEAMRSEQGLNSLKSWLGTDHNLFVLHEKLAAEPLFYGERSQIEAVIRRIRRYQDELRGLSLSLGERIYQEKPRHFTLRMQGLWDASRGDAKRSRRAA